MSTTAKRVLAIAFLAVLGAASAFFGTFLVDGRINYGVRCQSLDLSGMSKETALSVLEREYRPRLSRNALVLVYEKDFWQIAPREIDLRVDVPATVERALAVGRDPNPFVALWDMAATALRGTTIQPVVALDEDKLWAKCAPIAKKINRPVKNANLLLGDYGVIMRGRARPGVTWASAEWKEELLASLQGLKFPLRRNIEPVEEQPAVTDEDLAAIDFVLGGYTTGYAVGTPEGHQIERLAARLNETLIPAGKTFSLAERIKMPAQGFTPYEEAACGHIASTLFGAVNIAGLETTERHPLPEVPPELTPGITAELRPGSEFAFKNPLAHSVYLSAYAKNGVLTMDFLGHNKDLDGLTVELRTNTVATDGGYAVTVSRSYMRDKQEFWTEEVHTDEYASTAPVGDATPQEEEQ